MTANWKQSHAIADAMARVEDDIIIAEMGRACKLRDIFPAGCTVRVKLGYGQKHATVCTVTHVDAVNPIIVVSCPRWKRRRRIHWNQVESVLVESDEEGGELS